jgi:GrpB-like predicted nucleotidyltransferase (UPF0157 family)
MQGGLPDIGDPASNSLPSVCSDREDRRRAKPVVVVDYDPAWPAQFRSLHGRIAGVLRRMASAIEHVGSTAVPGLASKPILDIDVLLASGSFLSDAIERLAGLGYIYEGDLGIPGRGAFRAPPGTVPHHLYVCPPHSLEFRRHVALRNFLRSHSAEAQEYADLKLSLALCFPNDRDRYQAGKSEFVCQMTKRALAVRSRGSSPSRPIPLTDHMQP